LFNEDHMDYEADRSNDDSGEPSLTEMVEKAIHILEKNEEGFFLEVESKSKVWLLFGLSLSCILAILYSRYLIFSHTWQDNEKTR